MSEVKNIIRLKNISKQYAIDSKQFTALHDISMTIKKGEFVAIMGPSGAGKTTLLNILGLLDTPTSGSYKFGSKETLHLPERERAAIRKKSLSFVFQSSNLLLDYTLAQNVQMPLLYRNQSLRSSRTEALRVLQQLGLFEKQNNKPHQLSAGQLQKGAIACALIQKPSVLLADEPTGNLDSKSTLEVMKIFEQLHKDGMTIVLVTHSEKVASFADRILYMQDGTMLEPKK